MIDERLSDEQISSLTGLGICHLHQHSETTTTTTSGGPITTSDFTMSSGKLLGRSSAGTGAIEEITVGSNLTLVGGILSATSGGGGSSGYIGEIDVAAAAGVIEFTGIPTNATQLTINIHDLTNSYSGAGLVLGVNQSGTYFSSGFKWQVSMNGSPTIYWATPPGFAGTPLITFALPYDGTSGSITFTRMAANSNSWTWFGCLQGNDGTTQNCTGQITQLAGSPTSFPIQAIKLTPASGILNGGFVNLLWRT